MLKNKRMYRLGIVICSLCLMTVILIPINGNKHSISPEILWEKTYETPYEEIPQQLLKTNDDGYILAGSYRVDEASQSAWVLKVDSEGNEEWNQSYSHPIKPRAHIRSIISTPDGGYALGGFTFTSSSDRASWDIWIVKIDENGIEEWNRTFNGKEDGPDYAAQIVCSSDGGFLISGATQSEYALPTETWNTDYWLLKTDANGVEEWNKTYHRVGSDQGSGLIPLKDGNYLLSGLSRQTSAADSPFSIWVLKIDETGTVIWDKAYDNGTYWFGAWERNLIETTDGGFLLTCYPFGEAVTTGKDYWIIKCDSEGNTEWNTTFGGDYYDTPCVCLQSPTGDYYIGGSYNSLHGSIDNGDMCIVRLSSSGEILEHFTHGEVTWGERIVDMILTEGSDSSEAIIALAFVETGGAGPSYRDFWLGKFDNVSTGTPSSSTTPTTSDGTTFAGLIIINLGLACGVIYRNRKSNRRSY